MFSQSFWEQENPKVAQLHSCRRRRASWRPLIRGIIVVICASHTITACYFSIVLDPAPGLLQDNHHEDSARYLVIFIFLVSSQNFQDINAWVSEHWERRGEDNGGGGEVGACTDERFLLTFHLEGPNEQGSMLFEDDGSWALYLISKSIVLKELIIVRIRGCF
jgi:hypothetical protein